MTEHDIEINAMDAARREIGAAIRRLEEAEGILGDINQALAQRVVLSVSRQQLQEIDRALYEKVHPRQTIGDSFEIFGNDIHTDHEE